MQIKESSIPARLILPLLFFLLLSTASEAKADGMIFLPESHHPRYQTHGLFIDNQTSILYRDGGKAWGSVAAAFALFGTENGTNTSQLVVGASVNTAFRLEGGLSPETADARFDLAWETFLHHDWLVSAGYEHISGHINDSVLPEDRSLIPLDLGIDLFFARMIYDGNDFLRPGITIATLMNESDPKSKALRGNAFAEIFPWGHPPASRGPTPYLSLGVEEYGHNVEQTSFNAQVGVAFGNIRGTKSGAALRTVLGFYTGQDPRLKNYYIKDSHVSFAYLGIILDL